MVTSLFEAFGAETNTMIKVSLTEAQIDRIIKALHNHYMQVSDQQLIDFLLLQKAKQTKTRNDQP